MESIVATVSYLVHHDTLLKNTADTTKCDSYFFIKCDESLLKMQNARGFLLRDLLQNVIVITFGITSSVKWVQNESTDQKWVNDFN